MHTSTLSVFQGFLIENQSNKVTASMTDNFWLFFFPLRSRLHNTHSQTTKASVIHDTHKLLRSWLHDTHTQTIKVSVAQHTHKLLRSWLHKTQDIQITEGLGWSRHTCTQITEGNFEYNCTNHWMSWLHRICCKPTTVSVAQTRESLAKGLTYT